MKERDGLKIDYNQTSCQNEFESKIVIKNVYLSFILSNV